MKYLVPLVFVATIFAVFGGGAARAERAQPAPRTESGDDESPAKGEPREPQPHDDCRESSEALALTVDRKTVDLEAGRLQAKMGGPICSLVMRIHRKDGTTIEQLYPYTGPTQELRWTPIPRDQIETIELRITARDNAYEAVTLTPWSVAIEHQEVRFDTNKSTIRGSEFVALDDSLAKIKDVLHQIEGKSLGPVTLFIAGHTDTRGSGEHNINLSRNRADAIAAWFQKQGLCVPIAFEGFGETALKKLTADEVDEPVNRRVDYILAVEPPVIKKGGSVSWKLKSKGCP